MEFDMSAYIDGYGQKTFRYIFDKQMNYDRFNRNAYILQKEVLGDLLGKREKLVVITNYDHLDKAEVIFAGGCKIGRFSATEEAIYYKGIVLDEMLEPFSEKGVIIETDSVFERTEKKVMKNRRFRSRSRK